MNEKKLTLVEHLVELRSSLVRSFLAIGAGMLVSLYFSKEIFQFLQKPLLQALPESSSFIATSPMEGIITYLKVALLAGLFLSSPIVLYQIWRFIVPALYKDEKRIASLFVFSATFLFVGGALFGYFVVFPIGFKFFITTLLGTDIRLLPQMKEYLGFISKMLLTFGITFEVPLMLILLNRVGLVSYNTLKQARRYVLVAAFLIAGILTPGPDVMSQLLLALPLLVLYEVSVLVVRVVGR